MGSDSCALLFAAGLAAGDTWRVSAEEAAAVVGVLTSTERGTDAKKERERVRLHRIELNAQLRFLRARDRGNHHRMIRATRLQMAASARMDMVLPGRSS